MTTTIEEAAVRRAAGVRQRTDRPSQRRSAPAHGSARSALVPARLEVRAQSEGGRLEFRGVASAYESPYPMWDWAGEYTEIVSAGAGATSLARGDLDVPLVLAHDSLRRIASTLSDVSPLVLSEEDDGLHVLAPSLSPDDPDVAYLATKVRDGLLREMSFGFRIVRGQWSPDYTEYRITEYDLHRGDVSVVGYGANPATSVDVRSQSRGRDRLRAMLDIEIAM